MYKCLEDLLVKAVNNGPYDECFTVITSFYKDDLNPTELSTQQKILSGYFAEQQGHPTGLHKYFQSLSPSFSLLRCKIIKWFNLLRIILLK